MGEEHEPGVMVEKDGEEEYGVEEEEEPEEEEPEEEEPEEEEPEEEPEEEAESLPLLRLKTLEIATSTMPWQSSGYSFL